MLNKYLLNERMHVPVLQTWTEPGAVALSAFKLRVLFFKPTLWNSLSQVGFPRNWPWDKDMSLRSVYERWTRGSLPGEWGGETEKGEKPIQDVRSSEWTTLRHWSSCPPGASGRCANIPRGQLTWAVYYSPTLCEPLAKDCFKVKGNALRLRVAGDGRGCVEMSTSGNGCDADRVCQTRKPWSTIIIF